MTSNPVSNNPDAHPGDAALRSELAAKIRIVFYKIRSATIGAQEHNAAMLPQRVRPVWLHGNAMVCLRSFSIVGKRCRLELISFQVKIALRNFIWGLKASTEPI